MLAIDLALFHWLNGFAGHTPVADRLMIACASYAPFIIAATLVVCWASWRIEWQRASALAAAAALLALGAGQFVGKAVPRARPTAPSATILIAHAPDNSFPSDHAILVFAVTVVLATVNRRVGAGLAAFSVLVLISRVYVGVHYPTDVLGGAALGAVGAWATLSLSRVPPIARAIDALFALLHRMKVAGRA